MWISSKMVDFYYKTNCIQSKNEELNILQSFMRIKEGCTNNGLVKLAYLGEQSSFIPKQFHFKKWLSLFLMNPGVTISGISIKYFRKDLLGSFSLLEYHPCLSRIKKHNGSSNYSIFQRSFLRILQNTAENLFFWFFGKIVNI